MAGVEGSPLEAEPRRPADRVHEADSLKKDPAAASSQRHAVQDPSLAGTIQNASPSPSPPRGGPRRCAQQHIVRRQRNEAAANLTMRSIEFDAREIV